MRKDISRGSRGESWATARGKMLPQRGGRRGRRSGSRGSRRRPGGPRLTSTGPAAGGACGGGEGCSLGCLGSAIGPTSPTTSLCRRRRSAGSAWDLCPRGQGSLGSAMGSRVTSAPRCRGAGTSGAVGPVALGHPEETGASPSWRDSCSRGGGSLSLGRWTRVPGQGRRPWSFQCPLCCLWLGTPASPKLSALPTSKTDREHRPGLCWERSGRPPCSQQVLNKRSLPRFRRGEPLLGPPPHTPADRCAVPTSHEKRATRGQPCKHRSESGSQPRGCVHPQVTDVRTADPGCQGRGRVWGEGDKIRWN